MSGFNHKVISTLLEMDVKLGVIINGLRANNAAQVEKLQAENTELQRKLDLVVEKMGDFLNVCEFIDGNSYEDDLRVSKLKQLFIKALKEIGGEG